MLRLQHLVLEVLAVSHVALLYRKAQSIVVVVAHGHLVGHTTVVMLMMATSDTWAAGYHQSLSRI